MSKDLTIDEIIEIIKKESKKESFNKDKKDTKPALKAPLKKEEIKIKESYEISELCKFHDEDFIRNAYIALLKREPDSKGFEKFLKDLRSGKKDKVQILSEIRYSPEGKEKRVKVKSLFKVRVFSKLYKIPILGYFLKLFSLFVKLPKLNERINEFEAYSHAKFLQINSKEEYTLNAIEEFRANIEALYKNDEDYFGFKEYAVSNFKTINESLEEVLREIRILKETIDYLKESVEHLKENQRINEEMIDSIMRETYQRIDSLEKTFVSNNQKYKDLSDNVEEMNRAVLKLKEASLQDFTEFQNFKDNILSDFKEFKDRFYKIDEDYRGFKEFITSERENLIKREDFKTLNEDYYKTKEDYGGFKKFLEDRLNLFEYKLSSKSDKKELKELLERLYEYKIYTLDNQKRLSFILNEVRKRFPKEIGREEIENILQNDRELESLYLLFENRFRGFEGEIKRRLRVYLPLLNKEEEVLDLGCGRGEWLSLLKEEGFRAKGVDTNSMMVSLCKEKGLKAKEEDALKFLFSLKDESLGAITGFHIIEHLDFTLFIKILDEAIRVLKRGGVILFETPNPLNLEVGASSFYLDPSHKNPLHPESTAFFIESRGFVNVSYKLVEHGEFESKLRDIKEYKLKEFKDYISLPRDYALIGYKA